VRRLAPRISAAPGHYHGAIVARMQDRGGDRSAPTGCRRRAEAALLAFELIDPVLRSAHLRGWRTDLGAAGWSPHPGGARVAGRELLRSIC